MCDGTEKLRVLLEPPVENLGYELLHLQITRPDKQTVLRVYIDAPGGIQLDDCASVSRQLSAVLDVEDSLEYPLRDAYLLEVSSPGLERPLVKPSHFKQFVGDKAKIVMTTHVLGRRRFTGKMVAAGEQSVVLDVDGERYELSYSDMKSAQLHPFF